MQTHDRRRPGGRQLLQILIYRAGPLALAILSVAPMLLGVQILNKRRRSWRWAAFAGCVLLGALIMLYAYSLTQVSDAG